MRVCLMNINMIKLQLLGALHISVALVIPRPVFKSLLFALIVTLISGSRFVVDLATPWFVSNGFKYSKELWELLSSLILVGGLWLANLKCTRCYFCCSLLLK